MTTAHNLPTEAGNYSRAPESTAAPADVLKLSDAAVALGVRLGTMRRLIREGLPVVRRASARGGRGSTTWLHVPTARAWLAAKQRPAQPVEALLLQLASELPAVVAAALDVAGRRIEGPRKPELLRMLPAIWFMIATALRDNLTDKFGCPELATLTRDDMPTSMARLLDSKLQS